MQYSKPAPVVVVVLGIDGRRLLFVCLLDSHYLNRRHSSIHGDTNGPKDRTEGRQVVKTEGQTDRQDSPSQTAFRGKIGSVKKKNERSPVCSKRSQKQANLGNLANTVQGTHSHTHSLGEEGVTNASSTVASKTK